MKGIEKKDSLKFIFLFTALLIISVETKTDHLNRIVRLDSSFTTEDYVYNHLFR